MSHNGKFKISLYQKLENDPVISVTDCQQGCAAYEDLAAVWRSDNENTEEASRGSAWKGSRHKMAEGPCTAS